MASATDRRSAAGAWSRYWFRYRQFHHTITFRTKRLEIWASCCSSLLAYGICPGPGLRSPCRRHARQKLLPGRALGSVAASLFLEHTVDADGRELVELGIQVLVFSRAAGVAEMHTNGSTRWVHEGNEVNPLSYPSLAYPAIIINWWGPARCALPAPTNWSVVAQSALLRPLVHSNQ